MTGTTIRAAATRGPSLAVVRQRRGTTLLGAAVGAVLAVVATLVGASLTGSSFLAVGIPAATIVAGAAGPWVHERHWNGGPMLLVATATVALADCFVVAGMLINALSSPSPVPDPMTTAGGALTMWVIGLVIVGLPMLVITTPCAIVWALVVRELVRRGHGATAP
ncbi:MAG: hypothetical protein ACJ77F_06635 [Chloroflexota bacterium]